MTTFEIFWALGSENCSNCKELITKGDPYLRLIQNRWAKPCLCKMCMLELFRKMEDISNKKFYHKTLIKIGNEGKKQISEQEVNISQSGAWMGAWELQ